MSHQPAHNPIGMPFIELQSVDSTNNYARKQIYADLAQHGMCLFAHEQLAGKGQRGKAWQSQKGENIVLSIIIDPAPLQIPQQFQLSAAIAVAVHDFFRKYAGEDTCIKWPNDLYWQDRKAGGILIESVIGSGEQKGQQWKWAIAGIGINVNQTRFAPDLPNPVSLKQITGKTFSPVELAGELCAIVELTCKSLQADGFDALYKRYVAALYKKDKPVRLKKDNRVFEAVIKTVLPDGRMVIEHAIEETVEHGEVEWVL